MKRLSTILVFVCGLMLSSFGQSGTDNIALCVYLPQDTEVPAEALQVLRNQLDNLATADGNADFVLCGRFILTARIDVKNKDIVAGPPQKVSQALSITLQIGDLQEHKLFSSTTLTATGIGTNLTKSYMEAFKTLNKSDKQILEFLKNGREKILAYYVAQCESICQKAEQLANSQQYDEALYNLAVIPDIGNACYEKAQTLMADIAGRKINADGRDLLNQAKLAWAKAQNDAGAEEAVSYLRQIHPTADCQPEVEKLTREMTAKLKADDQREWELQLKQYNDRVRTERQQMQNEQELSKLRIAAARDAAVAFAKNMPQQIILW